MYCGVIKLRQKFSSFFDFSECVLQVYMQVCVVTCQSLEWFVVIGVVFVFEDGEGNYYRVVFFLIFKVFVLFELFFNE